MKLEPVTFWGKLYKFYLKKVPNHPFKVRIEIFLGRTVFKSIRLEEKKEKVYFELDTNDFITRQILKLDMYENESIELCKSVLQEQEGIFIDVGANFGLYTCLLKNYYSNCISIDASPYAFIKLSYHTRINKIIDKVTPIIAAASNISNLVGLTTLVQSNLGTNRITENPSYYITSIAIQEILSGLKNNKKIALMKIDVEGHEFHCLSGIDLKSIYSPQNILIEYEPSNSENTNKIINLLNSNGYEILNIKKEALNFESNNILEHNIFAKKIV